MNLTKKFGLVSSAIQTTISRTPKNYSIKWLITMSENCLPSFFCRYHINRPYSKEKKLAPFHALPGVGIRRQGDRFGSLSTYVQNDLLTTMQKLFVSFLENELIYRLCSQEQSLAPCFALSGHGIRPKSDRSRAFIFMIQLFGTHVGYHGVT